MLDATDRWPNNMNSCVNSMEKKTVSFMFWILSIVCVLCTQKKKMEGVIGEEIMEL